MKIGLVRHGVTDWNMENRIQGQSDIPLNPKGREQAQLLANRLKNENWDYVFSSDLSRARETADIIAGALGLPVKTDERLREKYCGDIEGTTREERIARWGSDWENLDLGIEDNEAIMGRGTSFVSEISETHYGKNVLIVSHGALIGLTLKRLIPHDDTEYHLGNTSITVLHLDSEWKCELYNCTKHLDDALGS